MADGVKKFIQISCKRRQILLPVYGVWTRILPLSLWLLHRRLVLRNV